MLPLVVDHEFCVSHFLIVESNHQKDVLVNSVKI